MDEGPSVYLMYYLVGVERVVPVMVATQGLFAAQRAPLDIAAEGVILAGRSLAVVAEFAAGSTPVIILIAVRYPIDGRTRFLKRMDQLGFLQPARDEVGRRRTVTQKFVSSK